MFLSDSLKLDLLGIFISFLVILIVWHLWALNYWKRKGVPGPNPIFLFGTLKDVFLARKTLGEYFRDVYMEYKAKGNRYAGIMFSGQATFVPIDLDLIKSVLQTNFQNFNSHGTYCDENTDPLSGSVFNLDGSKWRDMRMKLTPTFTSGKMKMMHQTLIDCSEVLKELLSNCAEQNPVDIKDIMARFTTDIIGSCAFGLNTNSMKDPNSEFRKYGNQIFQINFTSMIKFLFPLFIPHSILRTLKYQNQKSHITEFFYNTVASTIKYREENNISRKDFLDLLIKLKNSPNEDEKISVTNIAAQSFLFFGAGFETSSTVMNFCFYELAINQELQQKLREEINTVLKMFNNEITYEAIMKMEYLDRVVQETMRKYPPVPIAVRKCTKNYLIPGESIEVTKGTLVMIPTFGIHNDPEYYPNPEIFDPDRFTDGNKKTRPALSYIPFGEGPRICIGLRFGMLQTKLGIITLIQNYQISLNKKTITPLVYQKVLFLTCEGGIWLDLKKIL